MVRISGPLPPAAARSTRKAPRPDAIAQRRASSPRLRHRSRLPRRDAVPCDVEVGALRSHRSHSRASRRRAARAGRATTGRTSISDRNTYSASTPSSRQVRAADAEAFQHVAVVADEDEGRAAFERLAVDFDGCAEAIGCAQRMPGRAGAAPAICRRPRRRCCALALDDDARIQADAGVVEEDPAVDLADVDRRVVPGGDDRRPRPRSPAECRGRGRNG